MSTFSDSESATASPSETQTNPRNNGEQSQQSGWLDEENSDDGTPPLEMDRCPECGARRFVSKLLVYEVTSFDEGGEREFRRQHVRAEFEYTCSECQTILRRLPADRRDYYDEVNVLEVERRAALRDQVRQLCRRVGRRLWATRSWIALVLLTAATMVVWL
uniref:hypothetical protein n=1 Tax=Haloprofundus sp. MHR1 TaxID=2572921 RepID=UPI001F195BB5|nr:hypothetical protein [Haloprofundus sp. MHR1]